MGYPKKCNICVQEGLNKEMSIGDLNLSVEPFQTGKNPHVMLVGLNPTLIDEKASTVLQLDDDKSSIYKFIFDDILDPAEIKKEHVYATNLVKCTFDKEPGIISKGMHSTKKGFLSPYFQNCKRYFAEEITEIEPRILISLGQPPHQMIVEEYDLIQQDVNVDMKDAFTHIYPINIHNREIFYAPCIRVRAKPKFSDDSWHVFIKNLREKNRFIQIGRRQ